MTKTRTAIGAVSLVGLLALTGCGSKDGGTGGATATDSATAPAGGPGGFYSDQLAAIQQCLTAAGLEDKIPEMPTGTPTDLPTDLPTDGTPPSGAPDGGFGAFQDEDVQAALTACGIDLPGRPTGAPTDASTS